MRFKALLVIALFAFLVASAGAAFAEPASGQGSEFRLLNTSAVSGQTLLWSGAQSYDPQMCWQVFQSCQFFCGYEYVFIPDPMDGCPYTCWEEYLSCLGW